MKVIAAVFVGLLALTNALPTTEVDALKQSRLISDQIVAVIESISQQMKETGLDPFRVEEFAQRFALPVPVLLDISGHLTNLVVNGASNIVVNNMSYGILTNRLTMDIALPRIEVSLDDSALDATVLGLNSKASSSFKFAIVNARVAGRIRVNVGLISGIFLRDSELDFTLGGIEFDGDVKLFGLDFSIFIRELLTVALPNQISVVRSDINELVNLIVLEVGNSILN